MIVAAACLSALGMILGGCSGGGAFVPSGNLFEGEFRVAGETIGTFNFTATTNGIQGLGLMAANGTTQISIAAVVTGQTISGNMTAYTGVTSFAGSFNSETYASGQFDFVDPEDNVLTGTWIASVSN